ncbi:family 16 glycosylhydrolase [Kitasatospora sp. NPDC101176]|uniref:family 16 glycosylhydrolase n=1 Tax=Kitasatospora sp. NPDC101176 TaxID=3364099 RepID=UPI0038223EFF
MNGTSSATAARAGWALALSGWAALAVYALADADPVRVAVAGAFLLLCPGLAAVRSARPALAARGAPMDPLEYWVLAVALSLAVDTVIIVGFYLAGGLISGWALGAVAAATTLLALPQCRPRGRRPPPDGPDGDGGPGDRDRGGRGTRARDQGDGGTDGGGTNGNRTDGDRTDGRRRRRRRWRKRVGGAGAGAAALLLVAACAGGGPAATVTASTPPSGAGASSPTAGPTAPAAPGAWHLAFQDDFDGTTLDHAKWATCYDWNQDGCTNAGNHELQWYLPQQVGVGDGRLTLSADRSDTRGSDGKDYPWTSGMVSTGRDSWNAQPRHTFTRGYFAAAVRIPPEAGMFPAFWLLPASRTTPPELDVAEFISTTQYVQMTVHFTGPDGNPRDQWQRWGPQDFPAGDHVFALDWESDSLTWYVDGVQRYQVTDPSKIPDEPMELLLNLAVGYPSSPPQNVSSARMTVDWVRVWQH